MALLADRFAMRDERTAIDLATGNRVEIVCGTAGGVADQARWASRCSSFMEVHDRVFAPLIDFGGVGEHRRFEAWRTDGPWRGDPCDAERVCGFARAVLRATTRSVGAITSAHVRSLDGRPVLVPDPESGSLAEGDADPPPTVLPLAALGLQTLEHGAIDAIGNLLREVSGSAVRALTLWGPRGAGLTHAARGVARHARLCGCVPVDAEALVAGEVPDLARRSICLLVRGDARLGWQRLVEHSLHHVRPRLVLFITDRAVPGVRAIPLDRFSSDSLVAAVRPRQSMDVHGPRIVAAARQAQGLAGRMAAALWSTEGVDESRTTLRAVRASEQSPLYGEEQAVAPTPHDGCEADDMSSTQKRFGGTSMRVISWPAAGDTPIHLERLERGLDDLAAGRLARGERSIRDAIGCLTRRQAWDAAWRGSLGLARALRERGRLVEAQRLVDGILPTPARTAADETLLSALVLSGVLATDALSLDEAEALLSAAVRAARGLGTRELTVEAALALSRCLFWRGRYDAAEHALSSLDPDPSMPHAIRVAAERSRLALGRHDIAAAMAHASEASDLAETHGEPRLRACAAYAKALVHHSIGDYRSATETGSQAVRDGRRAGAPLLVLRARLLLVDIRRRQGHRGAAIRLVRRLGRMPRAALPAILRARVDLIGALLADEQSDIGPRQAQAAGAPGLVLYAAAAVPTAGGVRVSEAIDLLRLCQAAVDPDRVLVDTCRFVRETLQASAVGVFVTTAGAIPANQPPVKLRRSTDTLRARVDAASHESHPRLVCAEGGRLDSGLAVRVCTADTSIAPHALRVVAESGAPIRYGGASIGALVVRWAAGQTPDAGRVLAVLETVAAAIGPALAERRLAATASVHESSELIGISRPAADLRDAIERAAPAPFSVLIEGESGCGKELVARALHRRSPRRDRACVVINCASLPEELVESELFGHARGAFTGALGDRVGVFEAAHQGTLFLDEIGELSLRAQAKVLRTIQEGEIRRVGDNGVRRVDVRIVAATNRNLRDEVEAGRFRADLLYRLDVVRIVVPPLRERRDDVVVLAEHFWREAASRVGSRATLGAATLAALARYDWPGNVRELQNVLAGLVVRSPRRGIVPPSALPAGFHSGERSGSLRLAVARREFDANFVRTALARAGGCRVHAARELGVTRQGLTKLIARLGVETGDRERAACD